MSRVELKLAEHEGATLTELLSAKRGHGAYPIRDVLGYVVRSKVGNPEQSFPPYGLPAANDTFQQEGRP